MGNTEDLRLVASSQNTHDLLRSRLSVAKVSGVACKAVPDTWCLKIQTTVRAERDESS